MKGFLRPMSNQHDFYIARATEARAARRSGRHWTMSASAAFAPPPPWDAMAARAHRTETMRAKQEAAKAAAAAAVAAEADNEVAGAK